MSTTPEDPGRDAEDRPPRATPAGTVALSSADASLLSGIARDYLVERRRDRRWRLFLRLAWLLLAGVLVYSLVLQRTVTTAPSGPHTALIEVRGEIAAEGEASAENLMPALRSAFEDPGAQAVVLRFNSPGGSPVQAGLINDEIRRLKALHGKRVYAVVDEVCASGAYYIAVAADEIYVNKASIVGSIGVLMGSFGFTGLIDKLGVERRLFTAGEHKGFLDPFKPMSTTEKAYAQTMLDEIHRQFIDVVKQGRGERLKETPLTFSGMFWNGAQALDMGLVDKYGSLDFVAREVVKAEEVIDYTPRENVAERLVKRFGASIGAGAVQALRAFGPDWR